jgi:hypothetical protein
MQVQSDVLRLGHHFEIGFAVIALVFVLMVNNFISSQFPTQLALRHDTVLVTAAHFAVRFPRPTIALR